MGENVSIRLKAPIKGPNGTTYNAIVLREPTFDEVKRREDPYMWALSPAGIPFRVPNNDVICEFIDLCLVEPPDPALLSQADMNAARRVKKAIINFFPLDVEESEDSAS
jgi:hypothetical protein